MKVLVLAGGDSSERKVSLTTGAAVVAALKRLGHEVLAADPSSGRSLLNDRSEYLLDELVTAVTGPQETGSLVESLGDPRFADVDLVFLALHGGSGENGTVQALLDLA
ncbi:MAG: D-alanine--D-alanine ligase, partial [candidate division Zixibacteria bacterium]|nr:D-alanine--D-alanine ligase [candidate division Zixibacteria bacterium]